MLRKITESPLLARVAPFVVFIALTAAQGEFGEAGRYWIYLLKTLVGAWMLWSVRRQVSEMKWAISWEAVVIGVAVFVMWVSIGGWHRSIDRVVGVALSWVGIGPSTASAPWNPFTSFPDQTALAWMFVGVRVFGSSVVVPPLEEVFFRSFLYRWIASPDWEKQPLGLFAWKPFLLTAVFFGIEHQEWLAGILCGFAYQGLVIRKKRLGDAITAHAITNFLLAGWILTQNAWNFW